MWKPSIQRFARRPSRAPMLAAVLTACLAASAHAAAPQPAPSAVPLPLYWTLPAVIPVVGHNAAGQPDPVGEILIIIRDLARNPISNALVVLDFSGCADLRLCADPHDPGAGVRCLERTVSRFTNLSGEARFRVLGGSVGAPGQPGDPPKCARIYADGVLGGTFTVATYDLEGRNGLGPADLSVWLEDFFGPTSPRGDYDGDGEQNTADLSLWLDAYFAGGSIANCSPEGSCGP